MQAYVDLSTPIECPGDVTIMSVECPSNPLLYVDVAVNNIDFIIRSKIRSIILNHLHKELIDIALTNSALQMRPSKEPPGHVIIDCNPWD